jgi:hypothetical protein
MVKRRHELLIGSIILIASCSSHAQSPVAFRVAGAHLLYELPAPLADPDVQAVEKLRIKLRGSAPAYYVRAKVNNSKGTGPVSAASIELKRKKGAPTEVLPAGVLLKEWAAIAHPGTDLRLWFRIAATPRFSGLVKKGATAIVILAIQEQDIEDTHLAWIGAGDAESER